MILAAPFAKVPSLQFKWAVTPGVDSESWPVVLSSPSFGAASFSHVEVEAMQSSPSCTFGWPVCAGGRDYASLDQPVVMFCNLVGKDICNEARRIMLSGQAVMIDTHTHTHTHTRTHTHTPCAKSDALI